MPTHAMDTLTISTGTLNAATQEQKKGPGPGTEDEPEFLKRLVLLWPQAVAGFSTQLAFL
jgi:hypothetical protein